MAKVLILICIVQFGGNMMLMLWFIVLFEEVDGLCVFRHELASMRFEGATQSEKGNNV